MDYTHKLTQQKRSISKFFKDRCEAALKVFRRARKGFFMCMCENVIAQIVKTRKNIKLMCHLVLAVNRHTKYFNGKNKTEDTKEPINRILILSQGHNT